MTYLDTTNCDGILVSAVLAGEREAFGHLVRRYEGPLRAMARSRLGRSDWAEDVVQETFLCTLKWLHTYDSRFSFRTWLWTILLNQCTRHAQKQARHHAQSLSAAGSRGDEAAPPEFLASSEASPLERAIASECRASMQELLARLPEAQADALRLRFFGDLKFQEIADAMDCSLTTAKMRVKQGLLQLAKWIEARQASRLPHVAGDLR